MPNTNINRKIVLQQNNILAPPPVSGAKIWLRANGLATGATNSYGIVDGSGKVTQWSDLSGNGNHATYVGGTGTSPNLAGTNGVNAKKGITFDGSQDNLQFVNKTLTNNIAGATVFIVCKTTSVIGAATENEIFFLSANGSTNGRFSLSIDTTMNRWRTRCRRLDAYTYADSHQVLGSTDLTTSKVMVVNANYSSGLGIMYENGEIINWEANLNTAAGNTSATDSDFASIGNLISGGNFPFNGVISEIIFYNTALTTAECDSVNAYLQSYYGIASPSDYGTDAITTAYLARLVTLGYITPSANWTRCFNNFWAKQRANGNLALLDRFGSFQTENADSSVVDWLVPATSVTLVNSPTFTAYKGYTGNGTTQIIRTGFIPFGATNFTQNSAVAFAYTRTNTGVVGVSLGGADAVNGVKLYPKYTDSKLYSGVNNLAGTPLNVNNYSAFGIVFGRRTGANFQSAGINNEGDMATNAAASVLRPTTEIYLLGHNANGVAAEWYSGQISMWGAGSSAILFDALDVDYKTFEAGIGILS